MFSLSKVVKAVVNSAYYLCRLGFLGAFRRSFRLGLCGGFCLGLQPFHFLLCGMESSVGVIVQRHYNVGVSHDVLQYPCGPPVCASARLSRKMENTSFTGSLLSGWLWSVAAVRLPPVWEMLRLLPVPPPRWYSRGAGSH